MTTKICKNCGEKEILIKFLGKKIKELEKEYIYEIVEVNLSFPKEYLLLDIYHVKYLKSILGIPLNPCANSCELVKNGDLQIVIAPKKNPNYHPYSGNVKYEYYNFTKDNKLRRVIQR